jgi:hypothetical protein
MSVSDVTTGNAANLVDGNLTGGSFWEDSTSPYPAWCKYDFGSPSAAIVVEYSLSSGDSEPGRMPRDWNFQGSHNDSAWDTLDTRSSETGWGSQETRRFSISAPAAYRYYRMYATAGNNAILRMFEWDLFG